MISIKNRRLCIARDIAVSPDRVWDVITDTTQWGRWGPSVFQVKCQQRRIQGGTHGRIKTLFGFWLPFEITSYEEGRYWSWRVGGVKATGHWVKEIGENKCRLFFDMPLWSAFYGVVCYYALRRIEKICTEINR